MKLETAIETARAVLAKSSTCGRIKMVQEHLNFPFAFKGMGSQHFKDKG